MFKKMWHKILIFAFWQIYNNGATDKNGFVLSIPQKQSRAGYCPVTTGKSQNIKRRSYVQDFCKDNTFGIFVT